MTTSILAMVEPQRNGLLASSFTTLRDVAGVLGRTNKTVLNSVTDIVSFADIFNTLAEVKHAIDEVSPRQGYIPNEGLVDFRLKSGNCLGMAEFMMRACEGRIDGIWPTRSERESLRITASTLRLTNAYCRTNS